MGLAVNTHADKAARFLDLHREQRPLLLANAWDVGSAKLLASVGFHALATTSSGYAASLGRLDYGVSREEALAHAAALVAATDVPVSADLEDCFAADSAGVGETVRLALDAGSRGLLGRGLGPPRATSVRHRCGYRARRRGRRGGARRSRAPGAHRARRELPARQPRRP
ncbi:MAG: isocitrate lyase/phosphoenolpyruvate mutase family protein [Solirubrobacteraceae bacterium]